MSLNLIKEGAYFIADAHYPHQGNAFYTLIEKLENQSIQTPQLFLMGDIFDILFDYSPYVLAYNEEMVQMINRLSLKIEIIYIEGNHDFLLKNIFPNIKVYTRQAQPLYYELNAQKVALSHGDKYKMSQEYEKNTFLMRNKIFLSLMRPFHKKIISKQIAKLKNKTICDTLENFTKIAKDIISCYPPKIDLIIEGHYHQGKMIDNYISLPSLACQKKIGKIINHKMVFVCINDLS